MNEHPFVFISYSSKEAYHARFVKNVLERNGIMCFMAPDSMQNSADYNTEVPEAIRACSAYILIFSEKSQRSPWVKTELDTACKLDKPRICFDIKSCDVSEDFNFLLSKSNRIAAYEKRSEAYFRLVTLCRKLLGLSEIPPEIPDFSKEEKKENRRRSFRRFAPWITAGIVVIAAAGFLIFMLAATVRGVSGSCEWKFNPVTSTLTVSGSGSTGDFTSVSETPWHAYQKKAKRITVKDGVEGIGSAAFSNFTSLEKTDIAQSVTVIGNSAFSGCEKLSAVTLPENIEAVSDMTFSNCVKLESVYMPETLTSIGDDAFSGCTSLRLVVMPRDLLVIGECAFYGCSSLSQVDMSKRVMEIKTEAFCDCDRLKTLYIYSSVGAIGDCAVGFHTGEDGKKQVTDSFVMVMEHGSAGEKYAINNNVKHRYLH